MNKLKDILSNKKLMLTIALSGTLILIVIIGVILIIGFMNRKMSYSALEDELIKATSQYLKKHPEYYPTEEVPIFTLESSTLVNEKYFKKDIGKLVKDTCSATVQVLYKNNSYLISPFLVCNKYETTLFYDKVLADNPVVNDGSGLYDMNEMLVFRGDQPHNYVSFHKMLWRIVKMDPVDSKVYLIMENLKDLPVGVWDNRYNTTEESKHGINDYSVSIIEDTLNNFYKTKFTDNSKAAMLPMDICIGKRSMSETKNDGSVECYNVMSDQKYVSLLPLYDYINASTDYQCKSAESRACTNYNYLVNNVGKWWTLTADGSHGSKAYGINYAGVISSDYTDSKKYPRMVIAIDGTTIFNKGNGTLDNPYTFK